MMDSKMAELQTYDGSVRHMDGDNCGRKDDGSDRHTMENPANANGVRGSCCCGLLKTPVAQICKHFFCNIPMYNAQRKMLVVVNPKCINKI